MNEEPDIRAELGRRKEYKETIWDDLSDRTVYQWTAKQGKTKVLKTSVWTNTVRNYIRQKRQRMSARTVDVTLGAVAECVLPESLNSSEKCKTCRLLPEGCNW